VTVPAEARPTPAGIDPFGPPPPGPRLPALPAARSYGVSRSPASTARHPLATTRGPVPSLTGPGPRAPRPLRPLPARRPPVVPPSRVRWVLALRTVSVAVVVVVLGALAVGSWAVLGGSTTGTRRLTAHGFGYPVPRSWAVRALGEQPWVRDIRARGEALGPRFSCDGRMHPRASAGVLRVYRADGTAPSTSGAARDLALAYAATSYGADAPAQPGPVGTRPFGGLLGSTVRVSVRAPERPGCAVGGEVTAVALPSPGAGPGGRSGVRVFLLQHDTTGGPADPAPLPPLDIQRIQAGLTATDG
jgi:hypothetical protein